MGSILYFLLLFIVIFLAVRIATTGHVDNSKPSDTQEEQIVYEDGTPVS